jgi:hypothetical protein
MKGKAPKTGKMKLSAYAGGKSNVAKEMEKSTDGFKRGGKAAGKVDGVMSMAHAGRKPRKSGGGVMSSASGPGTPRGKSSHY